jgi:hypothetical protein
MTSFFTRYGPYEIIKSSVLKVYVSHIPLFNEKKVKSFLRYLAKCQVVVQGMVHMKLLKVMIQSLSFLNIR